MSDDTRLLEQADALMRRNRVFLAGAQAVPNNEIALDDLPVLTDVVGEPDDAAAQTQEIEAEVSKQLAARLVEQRIQLNGALEVWLDEKLPLLLAPLIEGLGTELVAHLRAHVRGDLLPQLATLLEPEPPDAHEPEHDA